MALSISAAVHWTHRAGSRVLAPGSARSNPTEVRCPQSGQGFVTRFAQNQRNGPGSPILTVPPKE